MLVKFFKMKVLAPRVSLKVNVNLIIQHIISQVANEKNKIILKTMSQSNVEMLNFHPFSFKPNLKLNN